MEEIECPSRLGENCAIRMPEEGWEAGEFVEQAKELRRGGWVLIGWSAGICSGMCNSRGIPDCEGRRPCVHLSRGWVASDETWGVAGERLDLCIRQMFK